MPHHQKTTESYDAAGNELTMRGIYTFTYDDENQQISKTNNVGNPAAQYAYDGDGHRAQKPLVHSPPSMSTMRNGTSGTLPCQTSYLTYDH